MKITYTAHWAIVSEASHHLKQLKSGIVGKLQAIGSCGNVMGMTNVWPAYKQFSSMRQSRFIRPQYFLIKSEVD